MSTSPDDRLVTAISRWLARHADDAALLRAIGEVDASGLSSEQAEAVRELARELEDERSRGDLERVARETLEALALG